MKVRYKDTKTTTYALGFNMSALAEVLTGDDSIYIKDLDVWLEQKQEWKDLSQAFKDHDVITDNHNTCFFEPSTKEERERGYSL